VSERDTALVKRVLADGTVQTVAQVPDVVAQREGGLLGIAAWRDDDGATWLYAYTTTADDNRVVRMPLTAPDDTTLALGTPEPVVTGIPKADTHNGGRIEFGPDDMLWITTGDAQDRPSAQDPDSLGGKILRVTPDGEPADDNPTPGSPVYSLGHRNPQGLAFDTQGRPWATEFGQDTWDEFNPIEPGANYGWPEVEGYTGDPAYRDPVLQWAPSDASPSGLVAIGDTFFSAALRGQNLRQIRVDTPEATEEVFFQGDWGRIRDAAIAPDGGLWFVTNDNEPDVLVHVDLEPDE
jgi:glucose/arabinose dehydrogenase